MKLGSHNSFTYLPVKKWYLKPLTYFARCQHKSPIDLCKDEGVTLFDLRVRFDKDGNVKIHHGFIEFDNRNDEINHQLDILNYRANVLKEEIYVRVILEYNKEPKDLEHQIKCFKEYCSMLKKSFIFIKFFGGKLKYNWHTLYPFFTKEPKLNDMYSSTQPPYIFDDWIPILYAFTHNIYNKKYYKEEDGYLFIDFVEL